MQTLSVVLWGLVVTKAKEGMAAAQTKNATQVGCMAKKVSQLIVLILFTTIVQFSGEVAKIP